MRALKPHVVVAAVFELLYIYIYVEYRTHENVTNRREYTFVRYGPKSRLILWTPRRVVVLTFFVTGLSTTRGTRSHRVHLIPSHIVSSVDFPVPVTQPAQPATTIARPAEERPLS